MRKLTLPVAALGVIVGLASLLSATDAHADRTLADYRYFRTLSIDLQGRMPTRPEIAKFESNGFDLDGWIDTRLKSPEYAERVRRIYMDLLRMEIGGSFQFVQGATVLRRVKVKDPGGVDTYVYYRAGQRRTRAETDGIFCLTQAESGLQVPAAQTEIGTAIPVDATTWGKYTKTVTPWWLGTGSGFVLSDTMGKNPDLTASTNVRVCVEEAAAPDTAAVSVSPFTAVCDSKAPPFGRLSCPPKDNFLQQKYRAASLKDPNAAKTMVACDTNTGFGSSMDCGCGATLERCMPTSGAGFESNAFKFPSRVPLGWASPFDAVDQSQSSWARMFWGQEFVHFFDDIVVNDADFRTVLSGKQTFVNGPLSQFYKDVAPGQCCGNGVYYNYSQPDPLVDPAKLPASLSPRDVDTWTKIDDRGPHAAGFLTMPVFLTKFGSRRARAHVLWNAFACKDFIAGNLSLKPSSEPDLTKRDGCSTCHATLEPLSAYFARVQESSWVYLPPDKFPVKPEKAWFDNNPANPFTADLKGQSCIRNFRSGPDGGAPPTSNGGCSSYYDPAFTFPTVDGKGAITGGYAFLRGAYASAENADAGPEGFAKYLTSTSQFESCVAENVLSGFLGRILTTEDEELKSTLADVFQKGDFKMTALVRALVKSEAYKAANNLSSTKWREDGAK
ncbi:hypothetical protein BH09MYX1_BH09MYX1_09740 [soil metagenome]